MNTYIIGEKTYTQKQLVLGQVIQLIEVIKDISMSQVTNPVSLMMALGGKLPEALAVILQEDGVPLKGRDIKAIAEELSFSITTEQTVEIVEHFFGWNPIPLWADRIGGLMEIAKGVPEKKETTSPDL